MAEFAEMAQKAVPIIAISVANTANARLLGKVLAGRYPVVFSLEEAAGQPVNLIIVDMPALQRHRILIAELRLRNEPLVLPVLLVEESRDSAPAVLGNLVDDVLRVPVSRQELTARIDNLVRLRTLSFEQERARTKLAEMVSALQVLNACDEMLVRVKDESELLQSLCNKIVEGGYGLACIGFSGPGNDEQMAVWAAADKGLEHAPDLAADWRPGERQVVDNLSSAVDVMPAHQAVVSQGLESAISLPLEAVSRGSGFLAIYSHRPGCFRQEEVLPLERLAININHALNGIHIQNEQEKRSAEMQELAYADALTGLPNRRYLINFLEKLLSRAATETVTSVAVLFIDLDGFKLINDALGHDLGDMVLIEVSRRLQHVVRETDLVIRQGGDEFLVVMLDAPRQKVPVTPGGRDEFIQMARSLANRIIQQLSEPFDFVDQKHHLSASIGISLCPDHGDDASSVIQAADTAMYSAKKKGGGQCHLYSIDIFEERQQRLSVEARLRMAISNSELELYYQPIFDMKSCRIVGTEALIRWPQADGEMLLPGSFIPIAEESGLIVLLGDWVLETAARQLGAWHKAGHKLHMAVNVSVHQLYPDGDAEHFVSLIRPHVDPCWVTLEITESVLMTDPAQMTTLLTRLNEQGIRIAIDDFGTGYSSLGRLQELSLHTLKIDRSFVNELKPGGKGDVLISIIQQIAANFGLQTVAEGIETEDQYNHLKSASIELGQGYWYGRPVPASEIWQRLSSELPV